MSTIIIGAGMAGLACARRLHDAGEPVIVLDKGRGMGGRLATRRTETAQFDHGAQYVTARDPGFSSWLEQAARAGAAALWQRPGAETAWWVGQPGMSRLVRPLAEGLDVRSSHRVTALTRPGGAHWQVVVEGGETPFLADRVVLAIPAPQALALLPERSPLSAPLARIRYAPCWTLMVELAEPLATAPQVYRAPDGPCAWVARDSGKPDRAPDSAEIECGEAWVIQAGPDWSERHLEETADVAGERLLDAFRDWAGALPEVRRAMAHRWRYARVTEALGEACLWDGEVGLGVAGDGCLGPRVEAAWLSGQAMAGALLAAQLR